MGEFSAIEAMAAGEEWQRRRKPFEPLPKRGTNALQGMPGRKRFTTVGLTDEARDAVLRFSTGRSVGVGTIIGVVFEEIVASGKLEEVFDRAVKRSAVR